MQNFACHSILNDQYVLVSPAIYSGKRCFCRDSVRREDLRIEDSLMMASILHILRGS